MVPRSLFLPHGQGALAWQARPVLPSGLSLILGSPQAEALALQVGACFCNSLGLLSWPACAVVCGLGLVRGQCQLLGKSVLPSGHAFRLEFPLAEVLALQVGVCFEELACLGSCVRGRDAG